MQSNEKKASTILIGSYIFIVILLNWCSRERFLNEGTSINLFVGEKFYLLAAIGLLVVMLYCIKIFINKQNNKVSYFVYFINTFSKYKFLIEQLLARDFKTKYKRSFLGVLWSLLNPMLTMFVQYIVFSTIFKSGIEYFPIYLLSGIIMFGFFTESCSMGIGAIVGNAGLITKVYIPKYIYPTARVLSSTINLLLSMIPLIIMIPVMGLHIKKSILLVPFGIICLVVFCLGLSLILSTLMVFFRDTQFLWGIISMLWMYATPIFYPESIWSQKYIFILKLNPIYHYIRFIRTCILEGQSPDAQAFIYCIIFSVGMLLLGTIIFRKNQDKFVLNL